MRRRLALVRALALGGRLYLLDEPFTGVDPARIRRLMEALRALDTPVLLSSHEALVCSLADRVICLDGPPAPPRGRPELTRSFSRFCFKFYRALYSN